MNGFKLASRSLLRKGRGNVIKIVSLGLGMAVGLILLTKVFFEYNYESFWPDAGRVHSLIGNWQKWGEDTPMFEDFFFRPSVSGGVAPAMAMEIPQVEAATRFTSISKNVKLLNPAREVVEAHVILADSCLHDVLPRPMLAGDAKRALATPGGAIVSRSLAATLGVEPGAVVEFDEYPGRNVTVEGIFEDIPENSDLRYDMAVSLVSITDFMWDGSQFWDGNDRYRAFLKLRPDTRPEELVPSMRAVQERHQDMKALMEAGEDIRYSLVPILKAHTWNEEVRRSNLLLLALAVALISIALVNYLIITMSTVIGRAREVAVQKCYGAGGADIRRQVLAEATLHIVLSLAAAALVVGIFADRVQEILGTSLAALFSWQGITIVAGVCLVLLAIAAYIPSRLFVNVPAAAVFRGFRRSRKTWKLALLVVQFTAAAAFVAILAVIWRQYGMMMSLDPGYEYENVVYADVQGTPQNQREVVLDRLRAMPEVEMVSISSNLPPDNFGGNNIHLPGSPLEVFNIADLYGADENYFDLWEIPVIEGRGFEKGVSAFEDMMVSRRFAERITEYAGWTDGVVGKTVIITGHSNDKMTITGVYEDFIVGSAADSDTRPTAMFYSEVWDRYMMDVISVRLGEVNGTTIRAVQDVLQEAMPEKAVYVNAMKNTVAGMYDDTRIQRNSIVLCSLITLLIVLLGLVGYLRNEIARRSAEIAIRKINGAETGDVLRLLVREIAYIAVPALAAGSLIAYYVSRRWVQGFSEQIALTPWLFIAASLAVLAVILAVAVGVSYRISVQNPVESLKSE